MLVVGISFVAGSYVDVANAQPASSFSSRSSTNPKFVTVVTGHDSVDAASLVAAGEHVAGVVAARAGDGLGPEAAGTLFQARGSASSERASRSEAAELLSDAQKLQLLVATEDYRSAEQVAAELMRRAERLRTAFGRDSQLAGAAFRGCLYRVQGALQRGQRSNARAFAAECRRLVPHREVSPQKFPPEVVGIIAEVDAELRLRARDMRVESIPEGCPIFLNGQPVGATPSVVPGLLPGDYGVRVDCGGRTGRVHMVTVVGEPITVRIDDRFDRTLSTDAGLTFQYPDGTTHDQYVVTDAITVARTLKIPLALVLSPVHLDPSEDGNPSDRASDEKGDVRVDLVHAKRGEIIASAWTRSRGTRLFRANAIAAAFSRSKSVDLRGAQPSTTTAWVPPVAPDLEASGLAFGDDTPRADEAKSPRTRRSGQPSATRQGFGWALLGIGVAGLASGGALAAKWSSDTEAVWAGSTTDTTTPGFLEVLSRDERRNRLRKAVWGIAPASSALLTTSLALILPDRDGVPWWTWLSAAAGAGLAGVGAWQIARHGCTLDTDNDSLCDSGRATSLQGVAMISAGVPLVSVPIIYALRSAFGSSRATQAGTRPAFGVQPTAGGVEMAGRFSF